MRRSAEDLFIDKALPIKPLPTKVKPEEPPTIVVVCNLLSSYTRGAAPYPSATPHPPAPSPSRGEEEQSPHPPAPSPSRGEGEVGACSKRPSPLARAQGEGSGVRAI